MGGLARGRGGDDRRLDAGDLTLGEAAYEGVVQWTGDLGEGVRAPEAGQTGVRDDAATGSKQLRRAFHKHLEPEDVNADQFRGLAGAMNAMRAKMPHAQAGRALMLAVAYAWPSVLVFATSALLILVGALGVITVRNPVHAALSLIMTLFGVAVAFVAQSADFLAAVQIIVYAGAIVVLFLFVIMYLGVDRSRPSASNPSSVSEVSLRRASSSPSRDSSRSWPRRTG